MFRLVLPAFAADTIIFTSRRMAADNALFPQRLVNELIAKDPGLTARTPHTAALLKLTM